MEEEKSQQKKNGINKRNDNKVNTAARTSQQHIYMTVQMVTPKLPAQMPEKSAREPKVFAGEKLS